MKITSVFAREVLDSRGNPTVQVDVQAGRGFGRGTAPSGASTGIHEALELRDGGKRYGGKGVLKAVEHVNKVIGPALVGMNTTQKKVDARMIGLDGTPNKGKLGANATVATSMAVIRAAANGKKKEVHEYLGGKTLPVPMLNVINGGKHAGGSLAIQEFMIIPAHAPSFREGLRYAAETYHALKGILERKYGKGAINVGDEGGFAPPMKETRDALDALVSAINEAGYAKEMRIGMDCAASSFYADGKYAIDGKTLDGGELIDHLGGLLSSYPVVSVEDPLQEDDFEGFAEFTRKHGGKMQVVGDDLLCTNTARIKTAIRKKACNALLLKINQIGTVTEAINAAKMAKKAGWNVVVSHRSGETEDDFIADFAVGIDAGQIKTGAPARGERTSKYNQLLRIEEKVGNTYAKVFQ